ncbi:ABC transporter substrate-binding protein [Ferrovibrio xuzhouensis]|uniref:ABC transporter substrate-binding protein n=1 Tax=Ferrovibrio xuzhouensis TaxID=1576914 RepID=A0ABV7VB29_9PROT
MKIAAYVGLATLAAAAVLAGGLPARAQPVTVGELGITADAPFFIGVDRGYFAAEKVEVKLQRFRSAADATAPLSTNQIQVAGGGPSAGLFNAFDRDWPVRIAMARTRDMPGFSSDTLLLRTDLQSSVTSLADLKGKTIAVNAPYGALHYMMGRMMDSVGMSIGDVKIIYMSWPDMGQALDSKAIDAGLVTEPFAARYSQRKTAIAFKRAADVLRNPPLEVSVILYSKDWTDANPEQAKAFTVAYLRGVRDYYDAMKGGKERAAVIDILTKHTMLKDKAVYDEMQWSYMDPNAELSKPSLVDQQDWYARYEAVKKKVDVDKMIDSRFIDYALGKLGRVKD